MGQKKIPIDVKDIVSKETLGAGLSYGGRSLTETAKAFLKNRGHGNPTGRNIWGRLTYTKDIGETNFSAGYDSTNNSFYGRAIRWHDGQGRGTFSFDGLGTPESYVDQPYSIGAKIFVGSLLLGGVVLVGVGVVAAYNEIADFFSSPEVRRFWYATTINGGENEARILTSNLGGGGSPGTNNVITVTPTLDDYFSCSSIHDPLLVGQINTGEIHDFKPDLEILMTGLHKIDSVQGSSLLNTTFYELSLMSANPEYQGTDMQITVSRFISELTKMTNFNEIWNQELYNLTPNMLCSQSSLGGAGYAQGALVAAVYCSPLGMPMIFGEKLMNSVKAFEPYIITAASKAKIFFKEGKAAAMNVYHNLLHYAH